jgi:hypothetical protein
MTNQDQMWMPIQDDAIEIYVRYLMGRHGKSAHHYARKTADMSAIRPGAVWQTQSSAQQERATMSRQYRYGAAGSRKRTELEAFKLYLNNCFLT